LDRGPGDAAPAVAPALPLVLRHDAGDLEAPGVAARARPGRQARPARPGVPDRVPDPAAAGRPGRGHLRAVRAALPAAVAGRRRVAELHRRTAAGRWLRAAAGP